MSRYTYAGNYKNPAEGWFIKCIGDKYYVMVREDRKADGSAAPDRLHTMHGRGKKPKNGFPEHEDAQEWIEHTAERFDEDYESYLEENHHAIVQMERYEAFRNEQ